MRTQFGLGIQTLGASGDRAATPEQRDPTLADEHDVLIVAKRDSSSIWWG